MYQEKKSNDSKPQRQLSVWETFIPPKNSLEALGGQGVLESSDLEALRGDVCLVYSVMKDRKWHSGMEIRKALPPGSDAMRRLRELRRLFTVERCRFGEKRHFWYRLQPKAL